MLFYLDFLPDIFKPHLMQQLRACILQQNNVCTGIVVDQNGETVIGASLVVKGTINGTITGLDGDFSIPNVKR